MNPFMLLLALVPGAEPARLAEELRPPVPVMVGGRPLDVAQFGHAAPFVGDFDGDGIPDLLVGQYRDGALRVYLGKSPPTRRDFHEYTMFRAGAQTGRIPAG